MSVCLLLLLAGSGLAADPPVTALAFAPDGKEVLVGSQAGVEVRSWPGLKPVRKLGVKVAAVHDLAFAPDGKSFLVAGGTSGESGAVELLAWPGAKTQRRWTIGEDVVQAVAWRGDGAQWACASLDGQALVFARDEKPLSAYRGHSRPILALVYLPGGKQVVSAGVDQTVRVWEADSGKPVRTMDNHTQAVTALALRPGQDRESLPMLASAGLDRTVRLWQPTIGRLVRFARLPSPVLTVVWTGDGSRLVAGCQDGQVRVLDPDGLDVLQTEQILKGWVHTLTPVPGEPRSVLAGGPGLILRPISLAEPRP